MTGGAAGIHPGATPAAWADAWRAALTALELDVVAAERILAADHVDLVPASRWEPPTDLGPLPRELQERAEALLDRQIEVARRLAEAAKLSRRHSQAAQAMRAGGPTAPVYIDTAG